MRYVALLRGIGPTNPNMRGENLSAVFGHLGFANVRTVIGSGNVIFDSPSSAATALESAIEQALPVRLGFHSTTIVRTRAEIEGLVTRNPFIGVSEERRNYRVVTFFKDRREELCTVIDLSVIEAPRAVADIEKLHGKATATRTWKSVGRILRMMNDLG